MNAGMLEPLDNLIDFNHPFWNYHGDIDIGIMDGNRYLAVVGQEGWFQVFYNYAMFEAEGMETPTQLLDRGAWTWDALLELARYYTKDTDGDGVNDIVGLTSDWNGYVPMMMTVTYDTAFIIEDANGIYHNNVNSSELSTIFNYFHTLMSEGLLDGDLDTFLAGNSPLFIGGAWYVWDEVMSEMLIGRQIAMAPSPTPGGKIEDVRFGTMEGVCIPRGAANPEGAAAFMYFWRWWTQVYNQGELNEDHWLIQTGFTEREARYFTELNYKPHMDQFFENDAVWDSYDLVEAGEEWSAVRERMYPITQLVVDELNAKR